MTGTSLFTVSRLLSAGKRGIVKSGRQRIVLTKPHALVAIAEAFPIDSSIPCCSSATTGLASWSMLRRNAYDRILTATRLSPTSC